MRICDEGVAVILWKGPLGGPSLPPLFLGKKKECGRKRSSKETTYDYYGFCPDGCHTDFDAFSCCSWFYPHFVPLSLDCNMSTTANLGNKGPKKKDDDLSGTLYVQKSLRVMLCPHSYASTRNLGVAPLMLWTPLILRRYLTIVCFWPWLSLVLMLWLQLQAVALRCCTFAPERLIGIFWVRRRNLSRLPRVQSIV